MSDRYRVLESAKPVIVDGHYYIALRDQRTLIRVQPVDGFHSSGDAERFLTNLLMRDGGEAGRHVIVEAAQIEQRVEVT